MVRSQCVGALVYTDGTGDSLLPNTKGFGASDLLLLFIRARFLGTGHFYNWAGIHHLIGGPIPVWLISAGIVASVMMVIPVVVVGINHHMSVVGLYKEVWRSPTLRFVVFGAISYTLVSLIGSAMALRTVSEITHFTHFTVGHAHHGVYAFFT